MYMCSIIMYICIYVYVYVYVRICICALNHCICIKNEKHFFLNEQKVGMLLQKRTDTRGVGISSMRKSIYLLTTIPIDSTLSH